MMAAEHGQRRGPKTLYERDATETMRISMLAKRMLRAHAKRLGLTLGDVHEHMIRTRLAGVTGEECAGKE
jgi:hypothetical protein